MVIAVLAMVSMLGALSMVIDAGVYFVLQRQLQNAADAAALDAVWYWHACNANPVDNLNPWNQAGCQTANPDPTPRQCNGLPPDKVNPCKAAVHAAQANLGVAVSLCQGPNLPSGTIIPDVKAQPGEPLNLPGINTYVVTVSCDAPHWFARVLPGVNLTTNISASASAALGWLGPNGQLLGDPQPVTDPPTPLVARLII
jgi:hypothetical protein